MAHPSPIMNFRDPPTNGSLCYIIDESFAMNYFIQVEIFLASLMAIFTSALLRPLGMPDMVSHVLGGILLGPSFLGRFEFIQFVFPKIGSLLLNSYASFATMFQLFLIGVQVNPTTLLKVERKTILIGISAFVFPLALTSATATVISSAIHSDSKASTNLMNVGAAQSLSAFPVIVSYLYELNIVNSEISRVTISSALISGILSFSFVGFLGTSSILVGGVFDFMGMIGIVVFSLVVVVFLVQPVIRWMIKHTPAGLKVKEEYLCFVVLTLMMLDWISHIQYGPILFGPFVLGMIIPSSPPLGSALIQGIEYYNTWIFMPIFYAQHGVSVDIFKVKLTTILLVEFLLLVSCTGKFLGAFLPALYYNMSYKDAVILGLTINAQGFVEISTFKFLRDYQVIDEESYHIMSVSMLVTTGVLAPLVRYIYKTSKQYKSHNRRTIQHSEPNTELRVLAGIYDEENVPSIIHLLKATNPTKNSPINVSIVHFVELVRHATPALVSHKVHKNSAATAVSQRIINVFKRYEENDRRSISVHPYTLISSFSSVRDDICVLAHQKRVSLIVLPFHKELATGIINVDRRNVNCNVLGKAPCSVGILIDRGLLGGIKFVFADWSSYHVVVVFLGGVDDHEALTYGERMSGHPTIEFTVIRFVASNKKSNYSLEMSLDDEMINDFKQRTAYNNRVTYIEEKVEDGLGVVKVIEAMKDTYELILLGRRHDKNSPLIVELTDWDKCSELGTVGDIFLTSDYGGKATILVVQQHIKLEEHSSILDEEMQTRPENYDC